MNNTITAEKLYSKLLSSYHSALPLLSSPSTLSSGISSLLSLLPPSSLPPSSSLLLSSSLSQSSSLHPSASSPPPPSLPPSSSLPPPPSSLPSPFSSLLLLPENKDLLEAIYISLGEAFESLGNSRIALFFLNRGVSLKGGDWGLYMKMGGLCEKEMWWKEAEGCLANAVKHLGSRVYEKAIYERMVEIAMKAGEWENALIKIDYFLTIDPENSRVQEFKLICLKKLGKEHEYQLFLEKLGKNEENMIEIEDIYPFKRRLGEEIGIEAAEEVYELVIEKRNWTKFLENVLFITKILFKKKDMNNLKQKHKKSAAKIANTEFMKLSISMTTIIIKERAPNPFKINTFFSSEEKISKRKQLNFPTKTSQRLQNIKANENSNNLEELLKSACLKKDFDFESFIWDVKTTLTRCFWKNSPNIFKEIERKISFTQQETESEAKISPSGDLSISKKISSDDMTYFITETNGKFENWLNLIEKLILHFCENKERTFKTESATMETNFFGPSQLLLDPTIRTLITKIYLSIVPICSNFIAFGPTCLTLFELLFEYVNRIRSKSMDKLDFLSDILKKLAFSFVEKVFFQKQTVCFVHEDNYRKRTYRILTLFFSQKNYLDLNLLKKVKNLLFREFYDRKTDLNSPLNEYFWMFQSNLNENFLKLMDEIIYENEIISIKNDLDPNENLRILLSLFEKAVFLNFDDAIDEYFPQIYTLLRQKSDFTCFLNSLLTLLRIYEKLSKTKSDELKKSLLHITESLKIDNLLVYFLSFLQTRNLTQHSSETLIEIALILFKIVIIQTLLFETIGTPASISIIWYIINSIIDHNLVESRIIEEKDSKVNDNNITPNEYCIVETVERRNNIKTNLWRILHVLADSGGVNANGHSKIFGEKEDLIKVINLIFVSYLENEKGLEMDKKEKNFLKEKLDVNDKLIVRDKEHWENEVVKYFECFHGIICSQNPNDSISESNEQKIENIEEIAIFVRFLLFFYSDYFEAKNNPKFKINIQEYLLKIYSFLKENDEKWLICEGFRDYVKISLNNWLESDDQESFRMIFQPRKFSCFCEENCFASLYEFFYSKIFGLIGKAFLEAKVEEGEEKFIKTKKNLKSAEQMLQINACFHPLAPAAWLNLASIYLELSFLYYDQCFNTVHNSKLSEISPLSSIKAHRILNLILSTSIKEEEKNGKTDFNAESKAFLIIFNILELMENKLNCMWDRFKLQNTIEMTKDDEKLSVLYSNLNNQSESYQTQKEKVIMKNLELRMSCCDARNEFLRLFYIQRKSCENFIWSENINLINDGERLLNRIETNMLNLENSGREEMILEVQIEICITIFKFLMRYLKVIKFLYSLKKEENIINIIYKDLECFIDKLTLDLTDVQVRSFLNTLTVVYLKENKDFVPKNTRKYSELFFEMKRKYENEKNEINLEDISKKIDIILTYLLIKFNYYSNKALKRKNKFNIYYSLSLYYSMKINLILNESTGFNKKEDPDFDSLFNLKTNELVEIYKTEKDPVLTLLFHRELPFLLTKFKLLNLKFFLARRLVLNFKITEEKMNENEKNSFVSDRVKPEFEKIRILNKKITKKLIFKIENEDSINKILFIVYKNSLLCIFEYLFCVNEQEQAKIIGEIALFLIKNKTINKFFKENDQKLLDVFDEILIKLHNSINKDHMQIEDAPLESLKKKSADFILQLANRKKKPMKKQDEPIII